MARALGHREGPVRRLPELVLVDHVFRLPLDHGRDDGDRLDVYAREVVAREHEGHDLPWLLFLQGGPGFAAPRPPDRSGWIHRAVNEYRVLLLDQRGTGRSTPATFQTLAGLPSGAAQADYLRHFRADAIVADAEAIRATLAGNERWTVLGQSFGGFCAVHYLSAAPRGLDAVLVTGGLPPLDATADDVYRRTYRHLARRNQAYVERYPEDADVARRLIGRLARGDVRLPGGDVFSPRRFLQLGLLLGMSDGAETIHYLLEQPFAVGDEPAFAFLRGYEGALHYDTNPLFSVLHEACYAQGTATRWAAERVRAEFPGFTAEPRAGGPIPFTGEMISPWMFDEYATLRPLREAAHRLAEADDWPALYDREVLAGNTVPAAAAVYADDMYVDRGLSLETAAHVGGLQVWLTDEHQHNALRADGEAVLGRLLDMIASAAKAAGSALLVSCLLLAAACAAPPDGPASAPHDDSPLTQASGGPLRADQAAFDVVHVDLAITVDPARRRIDGRAATSLSFVAPSETISLHLDGRLAVDEVLVDGTAVPARHVRGLVEIPLPTPARAGDETVVTIAYGGEPRQAPRPPWDGGFTWAETADGRPWIATSCQGEGADLWWPCKDHPSDKPETMDLRVTVPAGLVCASNGVLAAVHGRPDAGTTTYHWQVRSPISNYSVALNIAPYVALEETFTSLTGETFPFVFWVLPESVEDGREILPEFMDHMAVFETLCGPYPFRGEKYGVVETPHLGMEHQTIIAYGNRFRPGDPYDYDWLHNHELAHEWWANLVTCGDWKDMWIHEGFGTYMQALYLERRFGPAAYRDEMAGRRARLLNRRPVAPRATRDTKQIYFGADGGFDNDIYDKGACVLHTLRWLLGDRTFFEAFRRLAYPTPERAAATDGSAPRFTDTGEVVALVEEVAGRPLGWFFETYLRQPDLPVLTATERDGELALRWTSPAADSFPMPVPVRLGDEVVRVPMPGGSGSLSLEGRPWTLDPDGWLLRTEDVAGG